MQCTYLLVAIDMCRVCVQQYWFTWGKNHDRNKPFSRLPLHLFLSKRILFVVVLTVPRGDWIWVLPEVSRVAKLQSIWWDWQLQTLQLDRARRSEVVTWVLLEEEIWPSDYRQRQLRTTYLCLQHPAMSGPWETKSKEVAGGKHVSVLVSFLP